MNRTERLGLVRDGEQVKPVMVILLEDYEREVETLTQERDHARAEACRLRLELEQRDQGA